MGITWIEYIAVEYAVYSILAKLMFIAHSIKNMQHVMRMTCMLT